MCHSNPHSLMMKLILFPNQRSANNICSHGFFVCFCVVLQTDGATHHFLPLLAEFQSSLVAMQFVVKYSEEWENPVKYEANIEIESMRNERQQHKSNDINVSSFSTGLLQVHSFAVVIVVDFCHHIVLKHIPPSFSAMVFRRCFIIYTFHSTNTLTVDVPNRADNVLCVCVYCFFH